VDKIGISIKSLFVSPDSLLLRFSGREVRRLAHAIDESW
jgi:hypothetical protein